MSLDDLPAELTRRIAAEVKGRSDFIRATQTLHTAIVVALELLAEDLGMEGVQDRFASVLEVAVLQLEAHLTDDERDQYRRLYGYLLEMLEISSTLPGETDETS